MREGTGEGEGVAEAAGVGQVVGGSEVVVVCSRSAGRVVRRVQEVLWGVFSRQ